ncbi:MAG: molybdenum ABC transporter ATP-binding protein [Gemmatimonadetes bacterium]|nr:molybdenum ABC transporter ATP-binding protein [Gemmatimonadota bacterium]
MSALDARFRLRVGALDLDIAFRAEPGVTAILGPSGAGKTTVLRCLAGLRRPADAVIHLGDAVWQDDRAGIFVPPHRRGVGYVFQEADLFAHLSVRRNLRYALDRAPEHRVRWDDAVAWLGVGPLLDRAPGRLSGGERQRVAIARALLSSPRLLLMDEPLSALDEVGRRDILPYIAELPARLALPIVYVSHSLTEVARLADHVVWLVDGRIRRAGPPADVLAHPEFAQWLGDAAAVVADAVVQGHDDRFHLTRLDGPWGPMLVRRHGSSEPGRRVRVQIAASDVSVGLARETDTSILNQFAVRVRDVTPTSPSDVLVRLGRDDGPALLARITRRSAHHLALAPGRDVYARVKSVAVLD